MKYTVAVIFTAFSITASAQPRYNAALLDTLAQIANTNTVSKHFALLYYQAIEITNKLAVTKPDSVKRFIFGFEARFAPTFFRSYRNFIDHKPQDLNWEPYYSDIGLTELQYKFIGMNAHINGDFWRALKDTYSYDSIKKYKAPLIKFQKAFNSFFDSLYVSTRGIKKIKRLHFFTLGMDKYLGRSMILKARKRQVKLALLYYSNPASFERKWQRLQRRMFRWNRFALHWLK